GEEGGMARGNAVAQDQAQVLQIPLTPPAVALELVEERRGRLLVAALEIVGDPDLEACPPHQGAFHEVVAEDLAAEGRPARQPAQAAVPHEGVDPEDRVVPPVVALAELPEAQTGREHPATRAAGPH